MLVESFNKRHVDTPRWQLVVRRKNQVVSEADLDRVFDTPKIQALRTPVSLICGLLVDHAFCCPRFSPTMQLDYVVAK